MGSLPQRGGWIRDGIREPARPLSGVRGAPWGVARHRCLREHRAGAASGKAIVRNLGPPNERLFRS